jgi:RNA polymerase sigma-70 factor (ECF subfamily)
MMKDFNDPSDPNKEDPLESLLDEETDEEFGLPRFQEHFADSLTPAVLKDWSAKDFASIYVRFRPHLERHAKRFLVNPSQVEEVVQDAFLYLMTTLPELDSELGVLKFLKWKTRLLALDVIRANSRVSIAPLDSQREFEADLPEMGQELERADDAAIVSLALAKLQPRHREALIATLYEEKSAEIVSAQMGLSENAFRQLLFRSRSAFKRALIGEVEIAGLTMSEVLSIAARKAAAESGKLASVAGAFLLVLALSIGVIPNLAADLPEENVSQSRIDVSDTTVVSPPFDAQPQKSAPGAVNLAPSAEFQNPEYTAVTPQGESPVRVSETLDARTKAQSSTELASTTDSETKKSLGDQASEAVERDFLTFYMTETLGNSAISHLSSSRVSFTSPATSGSAGSVEVSNGAGLVGFVSYDLESKTGIQNAWFTLEIEGQKFIAAPKVWFAEIIDNPNGTRSLYYAATDLIIGDSTGAFGFVAIDDSPVSHSAIQVSLVFDSSGAIVDSSFDLAPRV